MGEEGWGEEKGRLGVGGEEVRGERDENFLTKYINSRSD